MNEIIYFGGPILTMDDACPRCEAVLVRRGRIAAVGTLADLMAQAPDAHREDLQGRTLMPAFVDGHSHLASEGLARRCCDLAGCAGFDELLDRIRAFRQVRDLTHGEVIQCRGYDPAVMREGEHPTAALLDRLGFDNPIVCTHISGHVAVYNTAAMRRCGVDDSFTDPEGGHAVRDAEGHLTGCFEEQAKAVFSGLTKRTEAEEAAAILEAQENYLANGFAVIQDGSRTGAARAALYRRLAEEGKLKADVVVYLDSDPADPALWQENIHGWGRDYRHRLKFGGVKLMLDGSPQARTAWMRKPYEGDPDYCGYPIHTDEWVERVLRNAITAGLQPLAHCNGDAAAEQFIRCWAAAVEAEGHGPELRPIMIHAQTVGRDQLERMAPLGMQPSFFVGHCWHWGDVHLKNFGDRALRISPVRSALEVGLVPSFHQDCPVTPPDMLESVWCAVNRVTRDGAVLDMAQAVTPYEALQAATRGSAYIYFEENIRGVLRPGALADLIVLDADPTAVTPMAIRDIRVLRTIKEGETLFEA